MARRGVALALLHLLITHSVRVQCGWYYQRLPGQALGHVFEQRHGVRTATTCCTVCTMVYACVAVNFWRGTSLCELNRRSPKSPVNTMTLVLNQEEGVDVYYADACDAPWTQYLGGCYLFPGTLRNWTASRDYCRAQAAELVDIQDAGEDAFVRQTAVERGVNQQYWGLWLGLGFYNTLSNRVWTSGKSLGYTNFYPGEPLNSGGIEDCIHMIPLYYLLWNDADCSQKAMCACEKPLY